MVRDSEFGKDWLNRYISSKYIRFMGNVDIRISDKPSNNFNAASPVISRADFLYNSAVEGGVVDISTGKVHWWLLKDMPHSTPSENKGHVGVVYQQELYDMRIRRSGNAVLTQAGIIAGADRVVLYFEPSAENNEVKSNAARSAILVDSKTLPMSDWADEFSQQLPDVLRKHTEDLLTEASQEARDNIQQRLEPLKALFHFSALDLQGTGGMVLEPSGGSNPIPTENEVNNGQGGDHSHDRISDGLARELGNFFEDHAGKGNGPDKQTPEQNEVLILPETNWVDGCSDSELEDRAAKYNPKANQIIINKNFRGYKDFVSYIKTHFSDNPRTSIAIDNVTQEYYAQALIQVVLSIQGLRSNGPHLPADYNALLTPEAFTSAAMATRLDMRNNVLEALKKQGIRPLKTGPSNKHS